MKRFHLGRLAAPFARPIRSVGQGSGPAEAVPPLPVTLGGKRVVQVDPYTCGALCLLMTEATGDPELAAELENHPERIDAYQRSIKARAISKAIGPFSWPSRFGIPPWTLAREARFPGVTYRAVPLDDSKPSGRATINAVFNATRAGKPVPLYVGGDLSGGLSRAIPRHVVLAVPHRGSDRSLTIFEPSSGTLSVIALDDLVGRTTPHPGLGNWTHIVWAILPTPKS